MQTTNKQTKSNYNTNILSPNKKNNKHFVNTTIRLRKHNNNCNTRINIYIFPK